MSSILSNAAFWARDNALVSPWAQGKLARDEVSGMNGGTGNRESPNPANRPGFRTGGPGSVPMPGGGRAYQPQAPWAGVAGGIDGGARGPNAPASSVSPIPAGFKAGIPRGTGATGNGADNGAQGGTSAPAPISGSESGPGILENWFKQRAEGTDPAYEYAMKRGGDAIDTRMAAGGSFNSGARAQALGDYGANMGAQREGQLDSLAAGASGEHQGRINSMFNQGLGLANGESGVNTSYDLAAGKSMSDALAAALGFMTNKAGVDNQSNQQGVSNLLKLGAMAA